jgi:hypothetical protein
VSEITVGTIAQPDRESWQVSESTRKVWWVITSCQELVQGYTLAGQRMMVGGSELSGISARTPASWEEKDGRWKWVHQESVVGDYEWVGISAEIFPSWTEKDGRWLWDGRD